MKSVWISNNSPRANEEWMPIPLSEPLIPESISITNISDLEKRVQKNAEPCVRDEIPRAEHVIEDPLAYYVPYHSPQMGIYFRLNKMLQDFRRFVNKYSKYMMNFRAEDLWHIYVMIIFWHEMAHHVLEDIATVKSAKYPLLPRSIEESFCEFNAFTTAERQLSPPNRIPILISARVPKTLIGRGALSRKNKKIILSCLYHHWNRSNPTSIYKPRVYPMVPKVVNAIWYGFWHAHCGGYNVIRAPTEIYKHIYVTKY